MVGWIVIDIFSSYFKLVISLGWLVFITVVIFLPLKNIYVSMLSINCYVRRLKIKNAFNLTSLASIHVRVLGDLQDDDVLLQFVPDVLL